MLRTKTKEIDKVHYCIYCSNESVPAVDYYNHGREEDHYETCSCKGLKQVQMKVQTINDMQRSLDYFVKDLKDKANIKLRGLQYEAALKDLKERFDK